MTTARWIAAGLLACLLTVGSRAGQGPFVGRVLAADKPAVAEKPAVAGEKRSPVAAPESDDQESLVAVTVDCSDAPDTADWGLRAKSQVELWAPRIARRLGGEQAKPPETVAVVFKKMKGVAATTGNKITISAEWVTAHPDDMGMVIHELTHVVQAYPKGDPSWLVEGIADYIRNFHFEPKAPLPAIDGTKQSYREGYKTAAMFLAWVEVQHGDEVIPKLNTAIRKGEYKDALFEQLTGKPLDDLWAAFLKDKASQGRK